MVVWLFEVVCAAESNLKGYLQITNCFIYLKFIEKYINIESNWAITLCIVFQVLNKISLQWKFNHKTMFYKKTNSYLNKTKLLDSGLNIDKFICLYLIDKKFKNSKIFHTGSRIFGTRHFWPGSKMLEKRNLRNSCNQNSEKSSVVRSSRPNRSVYFVPP